MKTVTPVTSLPSYLVESFIDRVDRQLCPKCGGGTSQEHSLSIRYDDDGIVSMKCYRASCSWFGLTLLTGEPVEFTAKKLKEARVYRDPILMLDSRAEASMVVDYGLDPETWDRHGWGMNERGDMLVMPVRDAYGRDRGHITRTLYETPKRVYTWKATSQQFLDWWIDDQNSAPVVVVEDTLSACRLSGLGYNAVALLGTSISHADALEIAQHADDRPVYIALDRDAFDKAIKLARRHSHVLGVDKILCLPQDIKNIDDDDDIKEILCG